jgi:DNA-binding SARP family transcriptional activator
LLGRRQGCRVGLAGPGGALWVERSRAAVGVGVELRALGPVGAVVNGELVDLGPPKQRALFALLLSRVGRPVAVDVLLEELWSGHPPAAAMASLLAYVCNLRRVLEPHRARRAPATVLRTRAPGYLLDSGDAEFDVHRFSGHATAGREALRLGDPQQALSEFDAGLALWRGEAYADLRDVGWVVPEVARLEELRLAVVEGRCAALLELGSHDMAVAELEAHVQANPLREHSCELLALALYRARRQADALGVLRATRTRLAEELGIDPGPALQRLERDILIQAPILDWHPPTLPRPVATAVMVAPQASTPSSAPIEEQDIFIGREAALQGLLDAVAGAAGGRGRVVLVSGEPGIGKTRLLRRFAELAGVPVLGGACPEHVVPPPLWPWEQVLRAVRARYPDRQVPGPVAALLAGQVTEMVEVSDVAGAALRRFEAIKQYLTGGPDPLVVVLDDVHWADLASLRLLAYLADTIASRLILVASYRSHESPAVAETLAALARAGALRIELTGLDAEQTQTLVSAVAGREVSKDTAARLWARTEGNPFFLRELIGLLASEHRLDEPDAAPVPVPVREVVLRRIARLPQATAALLSVAAVAGRDFDIDVVAEAASIAVDEALEAIDAAVAAGLVVEDQRLGWFGFTHALVTEALYAATTRARRVRRHQRIGAAAARAWTGHTERAAEIARHWLLAAELDPATAAQACAHAATAARVADARLAPEDATTLWQHALIAADLAGDDVERYPLLLGLATSLYRAGNPHEGLPIFVQAMDQALTEDNHHGISRLVTTAVTALAESNWYPVAGSVNDEQLIDVLQRALPRLTDPVPRALLLACLAVARYYDDDPQRRITLSDQALALARPAADPVALAGVLHLRAMALNTPDYPEQCLQAVDELLKLPGLPAPTVAGARLLHATLSATVGRIADAATELDQAVPFIEQAGSPVYRMQLGWAQAGLLLLAGRWPEAEAISRATYHRHVGMSWGVGGSVAQIGRMGQRWEAAYLAGTGADLLDELRATVKSTGSPTLRSILTMALIEAGDPTEARTILRSLPPEPKDYRWLYIQCWSLLAAAQLAEIELVSRLRDQLLPYRQLACAVFAAVVSGSVAYFTGEAALALGDPDAALADLTIAIKADEAMGALPWLAKARDAVTRARHPD